MRLSARPGARILRGLRARLVLAGEHAARERRIAHHAEPVVGAGRKLLDFGDAIERVIIGLVHDRPIDAHLVAQIADLGDAPGAMVRHAEVADLAVRCSVAERAHGLGERRVVILLVQIEDVDVVGAEPAQAFLARTASPICATARRGSATCRGRCRAWSPAPSRGAGCRSRGRRSPRTCRPRSRRPCR